MEALPCPSMQPTLQALYPLEDLLLAGITVPAGVVTDHILHSHLGAVGGILQGLERQVSGGMVLPEVTAWRRAITLLTLITF